MKYNINNLISKDKKEVELIDGTVLDLTFRPNIVNRLYSDLSGEQIEIQEIMKDYKNMMNKMKNMKDEEDAKAVEDWIKKSKKLKERLDSLTSSVQDKIKQIIKITVEKNPNEIEIDDAWYEERTQEEINLLIQIIFGMIKEEDKKK